MHSHAIGDHRIGGSVPTANVASRWQPAPSYRVRRCYLLDPILNIIRDELSSSADSRSDNPDPLLQGVNNG